jgi:hypothetical protein
MLTDISLSDDILSILRYGKENAITGRELAKILGHKNDRFIREQIRQLIAAGHPIAASVGEPPGYYLANSLEEANEYISGLRSRLVQDAYRTRDFKIATKNIRQPGQLTMALR